MKSTYCAVSSGRAHEDWTITQHMYTVQEIWMKYQRIQLAKCVVKLCSLQSTVAQLHALVIGTRQTTHLVSDTICWWKSVMVWLGRATCWGATGGKGEQLTALRCVIQNAGQPKGCVTWIHKASTVVTKSLAKRAFSDRSVDFLLAACLWQVI